MMPNKLYKYRAFGVRALHSLAEAKVLYAQPRSVNDPLDCHPTFDVDVGRTTIEKLLYRMLQRRFDKAKAAEKVNYLRYLSTEYGDYETDMGVEAYLVRMLARDIKAELDDEFARRGVLSLAATWSSVLMWSHYADEHRDICVEYNTGDHHALRVLQDCRLSCEQSGPKLRARRTADPDLTRPRIGVGGRQSPNGSKLGPTHTART
jgi:hypothetical protein